MNEKATGNNSGTNLTQPRSATVHAVDSELDYLGKVIARCRGSWPNHPALGTLQAQLASWNNGKGNRKELRKLIPRTIDGIMGRDQ